MIPSEMEGGAKEMYEKAKTAVRNGEKPDGYPDLPPLTERGSTEIRVKGSAGGDSEQEMLKNFAFSAPIAKKAEQENKLYGFMLSANVVDLLQRRAIMATNLINDLLMDAPCLNREDRMDYERKRARYWRSSMEHAPTPGEEVPDPEHLINLWSSAHAFKLQARIYQDIHGIDEAESFVLEEDPDESQEQEQSRLPRWDFNSDRWRCPVLPCHGWDRDRTLLVLHISHHPEEPPPDLKEAKPIRVTLFDRYKEMAELMEKVLVETTKLTSDQNMYFWCRIREVAIGRERSYDLALGHPTVDLHELKESLASGKPVHDLIPDMLWPFKIGFHEAMGTMLDGEAHRGLLISMMSGQHPPQPAPMMPYMMPGYPMQQGGDEQVDQRKPIWDLSRFRNGHQQQPQQRKPLQRRASKRQ